MNDRSNAWGGRSSSLRYWITWRSHHSVAIRCLEDTALPFAADGTIWMWFLRRHHNFSTISRPFSHWNFTFQPPVSIVVLWIEVVAATIFMMEFFICFGLILLLRLMLLDFESSIVTLDASVWWGKHRDNISWDRKRWKSVAMDVQSVGYKFHFCTIHLPIASTSCNLSLPSLLHVFGSSPWHSDFFFRRHLLSSIHVTVMSQNVTSL